MAKNFKKKSGMSGKLIKFNFMVYLYMKATNEPSNSLRFKQG